MKRLFRPTTLVVISMVLLGGAIVVLWPLWGNPLANKAVPQPVPQGDQEIAYLGTATNNAATWERLVAAVRRLQADEPGLQLQVVAEANAFPSQTTAVPELAVTAGGSKARLWFRWYKLTGGLGTQQWVEALGRRQPPPLAIIGGGSSDRALDLARELNTLRAYLPAPPLFLITTATADQVTVDNEPADLMRIYAGRSFRFCFTNQQMAEAVTDFIWHQDDLRPDAEPVYLVYWEDDPYSEDLFARFRRVLWGEEGTGGILGRAHTATVAARAWATFAGRTAVGTGWPAAALGGLLGDDVPRPQLFSVGVHFSIGDFNQPNLYEAGAADKVMGTHSQHPAQRRPLLVVPATPQPARRFLRALMHMGPVEAEQFVVATGDGIDFNTIYRDRNLAWPIQDLPFALVLFCHRNPVDPSAFQPDGPGSETEIPDPAGRTATGTQDLLLYRDIVATVLQAAYRDHRLLASADDLRTNLAEQRLANGGLRFDTLGNQRSGGGEYVVRLKPDRAGDRVSPRAFLQVWNRSADQVNRKWIPVPVAGHRQLDVVYTAGAGTAVLEDKP